MVYDGIGIKNGMAKERMKIHHDVFREKLLDVLKILSNNCLKNVLFKHKTTL